MYKIRNIKTGKEYEYLPAGPQPDGTYIWDCYYIDNGVKKVLTREEGKNFVTVGLDSPKNDHQAFVTSFPSDICEAILDYEDTSDEDIRDIFDFDGKSHDEIRRMLGITKENK